MKFSRSFSVLVADSAVRVVGKAPKPSPAAIDRSQILSKLERSFLHERLNTTHARLVFRPTKSYKLEGRDPVVVNGEVLQPQTYPGLPSVANLTDLIASSQTAEDIQTALNYLEQYAKYEQPRANLRPEHLAQLLRKAAEFDQLRPVLFSLSSRQNKLYKEVFTGDVHLELLRIRALQAAADPTSRTSSVPSLLERYQQCERSFSREAALLFGFAAHQRSSETRNVHVRLVQKHAMRCAGQFDNLKAVKRPNPLDVALALDAAKALEQPRLEAVLQAYVSEVPSPEEQTLYSVAVAPKPLSTEERSGNTAEAETSA